MGSHRTAQALKTSRKYLISRVSPMPPIPAMGAQAEAKVEILNPVLACSTYYIRTGLGVMGVQVE